MLLDVYRQQRQWHAKYHQRRAFNQSSVTDYVAYKAGTTSAVAVDGSGSTWNAAGSTLDVGWLGTGTLNISGGGAVTATSVSVNSTSLLSIDVGRGSYLTVGGTGLTNNGTVRVVAGASPADGNTYTPITAGTWAGTTGTVQALGGTWDSVGHVFTVSSVTSGADGSPVSLDPGVHTRMLITNSAGASLVASFLSAASTGTSIGLTASTVGGLNLTNLQTVMTNASAIGSVQSAWTLVTSAGSAFTKGASPAYLSLSAACYPGTRACGSPTTAA